MTWLGLCVHPGGNRWNAFLSHVQDLLQCVTAVINIRSMLSVRSVRCSEGERMEMKVCCNFKKSRSLCSLCFLTTEIPMMKEGKCWSGVLKSSLSVQLSVGKVLSLQLGICAYSYFESFYDAAFFSEIKTWIKIFQVTTATSFNLFSTCRPEFTRCISRMASDS